MPAEAVAGLRGGMPTADLAAAVCANTAALFKLQLPGAGAGAAAAGGGSGGV